MRTIEILCSTLNINKYILIPSNSLMEIKFTSNTNKIGKTQKNKLCLPIQAKATILNFLNHGSQHLIIKILSNEEFEKYQKNESKFFIDDNMHKKVVEELPKREFLFQSNIDTLFMLYKNI